MWEQSGFVQIVFKWEKLSPQSQVSSTLTQPFALNFLFPKPVENGFTEVVVVVESVYGEDPLHYTSGILQTLGSNHFANRLGHLHYVCPHLEIFSIPCVAILSN